MQTDGGAFSVGFQGMDATADVCWAVSCRAAAGVFAVERDATSIPVGTLGVAGAADDILTGHNRPLWRSAPPVGQHRRRSPCDRLFRSPPRTPCICSFHAGAGTGSPPRPPCIGSVGAGAGRCPRPRTPCIGSFGVGAGTGRPCVSHLLLSPPLLPQTRCGGPVLPHCPPCVCRPPLAWSRRCRSPPPP
jgi:hypothetical protein